MKTFMTVALMFIMIGSAMAQIDPDTDGMSVYFDTEGQIYCYDTMAENTVVTAYLLLTNPSADQVRAWEAHVEVEFSGWTGSWSPVNASPMGTGPEDWMIATVPPLEASGSAVILMWMDMHFGGLSTDYAVFTVTGIPGSLSFPQGVPGYAPAPYELTPCNLIHDNPGDPVAWINRPEDCIDIVGSERNSWGAVKRLY